MRNLKRFDRYSTLHGIEFRADPLRRQASVKGPVYGWRARSSHQDDRSVSASTEGGIVLFSKSRLAGRCIQGFLLNPEDHKFRRLDGSDADQTDQPAIVDVILRHRGTVAFHEERLVGFCPLQGTTSPGGGQEIRDCLPNARAQSGSSLGSNTTHCVPLSMQCST